MDAARSLRETDLQVPRTNDENVQPRLVARDDGVEAQAVLV
jgi:hypothetical protein